MPMLGLSEATLNDIIRTYSSKMKSNLETGWKSLLKFKKFNLGWFKLHIDSKSDIVLRGVLSALYS